MKKTLIHSYLTNGSILFDFAKLFLSSFKKYNGDDYPILFEGKDLKKRQIIELENLYDNLTIVNKTIDYKDLSKRLGGISIKRILQMKKDCELKRRNVASTGCLPWKQFISVDDRYRNSIKYALNYCQENNINQMLHFDIDIAFYRPIDSVVKIVSENDVTLQFRSKENIRLQKTIINGSFSGYSINENAFRFIEKWREYIDKIPLKDKPMGYGQLSCYYAYLDMVNKIKIHKLSNFTSSTRVTAKRWMMRKDVIWFNGAKGNKRENLELFTRMIRDKKK